MGGNALSTGMQFDVLNTQQFPSVDFVVFGEYTCRVKKEQSTFLLKEQKYCTAEEIIELQLEKKSLKFLFIENVFNSRKVCHEFT